MKINDFIKKLKIILSKFRVLHIFKMLFRSHPNLDLVHMKTCFFQCVQSEASDPGQTKNCPEIQADLQNSVKDF